MDDSATIDKLLDERLRLIQIINAALLAGLVFFTGFVLFGTANDKLPATAGQLTYAVVAFFFVMLLVWVFVPPRFADRQVTKIASGTWTLSQRSPAAQAAFATDSAKLLFVYQSKSIISAALLEGSAFFAAAVYMMQRQWFVLAIVAAAVLLMLAMFPTRRRVRTWIETRLFRIDEMRQFVIQGSSGL
jgi:hypothetical protein